MTAPTAEWWKFTTTALAGVLMTLGSLFASGKLDSLSKAETIEIVKTAAPYVEDRKAILDSVQRNSNQISKLIDANGKLSRQMGEFLGELRAMRSHK